VTQTPIITGSLLCFVAVLALDVEVAVPLGLGETICEDLLDEERSPLQVVSEEPETRGLGQRVDLNVCRIHTLRLNQRCPQSPLTFRIRDCSYE